MNQVRMKNEKIRQTLKIVCWNFLNEKKKQDVASWIVQLKIVKNMVYY